MSIQNISPLIGTEIMELLNVPAYGLDDPKQFKQIREIVDYFQSRPDYRRQLLNVITKRPSADKLDTVWTWLQLQKEKEAKISTLNPDDFTEDVAKEIVDKHLTKDTIARLKANLVQEQQRAILKRREAKEQAIAEKQNEAIDTVTKTNDYGTTLATIQEIELLTNTITNLE